MKTVVMAPVTMALILATAVLSGPAVAKEKPPKEKISDLPLVNWFEVPGDDGKPVTLVAEFQAGVWEATRSRFLGELGCRLGYRTSPEQRDVQGYIDLDVRSTAHGGFDAFVEALIGRVDGDGAGASIVEHGSLKVDLERLRGVTKWALLPSVPRSWGPMKKHGALISVCQYVSSHTVDVGKATTSSLVILPLGDRAILATAIRYPDCVSVLSLLEAGLSVRSGGQTAIGASNVKFAMATPDSAHFETVNGAFPKELGLLRIWERKQYEDGVVGLWVSRDARPESRLALRLSEAPGDLGLDDYISSRVGALKKDLPIQKEQKADRKLFPHVWGRWFRMTAAVDDAESVDEDAPPQPVIYKVFTQNPDHTDVEAKFIQEWTLEILDPKAEKKTVKEFKKFLKSLHGWVRKG